MSDWTEYKPDIVGFESKKGEMNAGRQLDALIAEKVMGWKWADAKYYGWKQFSNYPPEIESVSTTKLLVPPDGPDRLIPGYSTEIAAAWEVVEKVRALPEAQGWGVMVGALPSGTFQCWLKYRDCENTDINERAATAPLAICLAALKAVGG